MKGNIIPELIWRWMKANDTLIELPETEKKDFNIYENNIVEDNKFSKEFENESYGVSEEILELNKKNRNWTNFVNSDNKYNIKLNDGDMLNDKQEIYLSKNEKATILYDYHQDGEYSFLNSVYEIFLEEGSELNLVISQRLGKEAYSFLSLIGNIKSQAKLNLIHVDLGSKESYANILGNLKEEHATFDLNSAYFGYGSRKIDLVYTMEHLKEKTNSNMEVSGVLKDTSKKRFVGTLDFKKGSMGSIGSEEEIVTLLNDKVKSTTVPLLLSHESDIVGEHAASAGRIDEGKLYYIMSRGFSESEAKTLIVESRMNPIIDLIEDEKLREEIKGFIRKGIQD